MSRIQKLPTEAWDAELRTMTLADEGTPLEQGLMRIIAHRPEMAKGMVAFSGALLRNNGLPRRLVELVRLRVAFHNQCRSCMAIRYSTGLDDGLTEDLVCSLERPQEAEDLTAAERAALAYADLMATDHLAADDAMFDRLRQYFTEPQIVELGYNCALYVGFGRMAATWDMYEELPERFQERSELPITPWGEGELIRG
jgi:alkylhydroperoxidase family enzyme